MGKSKSPKGKATKQSAANGKATKQRSAQAKRAKPKISAQQASELAMLAMEPKSTVPPWLKVEDGGMFSHYVYTGEDIEGIHDDHETFIDAEIFDDDPAWQRIEQPFLAFWATGVLDECHERAAKLIRPCASDIPPGMKCDRVRRVDLGDGLRDHAFTSLSHKECAALGCAAGIDWLKLAIADGADVKPLQIAYTVGRLTAQLDLWRHDGDVKRGKTTLKTAAGAREARSAGADERAKRARTILDEGRDAIRKRYSIAPGGKLTQAKESEARTGAFRMCKKEFPKLKRSTFNSDVRIRNGRAH